MVSFLRNSFIVLVLAGCYSPRKAERQLDRAMKYPEKVAAVCSTAFPVTIKADTVENTEYDFIEIEGQDRYIYIDSIHRDTVIKYATRKVQLPAKVITVTNTVKDSAELYKLWVEVQNWQDNTKKEKLTSDSYLKMVKALGSILFLFLLALLGIKQKKKK